MHKHTHTHTHTHTQKTTNLALVWSNNTNVTRRHAPCEVAVQHQGADDLQDSLGFFRVALGLQRTGLHHLRLEHGHKQQWCECICAVWHRVPRQA